MMIFALDVSYFFKCFQVPFFEILINRSNPHIAAVWVLHQIIFFGYAYPF